MVKTEDAEKISPKILCVDDEHAILSSLRRIFRRQGYKIMTASSTVEALTFLEENDIDLLISDMRMPQMNGDKLLVEVANRWPETQRILLTGYAELEDANRAEDEGGIYCRIEKPWDDDDLINKVNQALLIKHNQTGEVANVCS